jgi:hypothetical protein
MPTSPRPLARFPVETGTAPNPRRSILRRVYVFAGPQEAREEKIMQRPLKLALLGAGALLVSALAPGSAALAQYDNLPNFRAQGDIQNTNSGAAAQKNDNYEPHHALYERAAYRHHRRMIERRREERFENARGYRDDYRRGE